MKISYEIDESLCSSCGLCVTECSLHIPIDHGGHVKPGVPQCNGCLHCYSICPNGAIKIKSNGDIPHKSNEDIPQQKNEIVNSTELLISLFASRRSHRRFKDRDVEKEIIEKLIKAAKYIPSGGNRQACEFTVLLKTGVRNELVREFTRIYSKRSKLLNNPLLRNLASPFVDKQVRGFLKDKDYRKRMAKLVERFIKGEDPVFYNAPAVIIIHSKASIPTPREDCVLAGYNIVLTAETLGLGTCFVTLGQNALNSSNKCKRLINLSPKDNIYEVVLVGYPAVDYLRNPTRNDKAVNWC